MSYTLIEQYSRDIDYYVVNIHLGLLHFASAGGKLPSIIEGNDLNNEALHIAILNLPDDFEIQTNPNLQEILGLNEQQLESYLVDFIAMAKKGLFSFDKTNINNQEDQTYHLVAWPKNPRSFTWPFKQLQPSVANIILNWCNIPFNENPKDNWKFKLNLDHK